VLFRKTAQTHIAAHAMRAGDKAYADFAVVFHL